MYKKFPCNPREYAKTVGGLLIRLIGEIFNELGFKAVINESKVDEADIKIYQNGKLVLAGEVLNWGGNSTISRKRRNQIVKNLSKLENCIRVLFCSSHPRFSQPYDPRITRLAGCPPNVRIVCFGFQILPKEFYYFFRERNRDDDRETLNEETKASIKEDIKSLLRKEEDLIQKFSSS